MSEPGDGDTPRGVSPYFEPHEFPPPSATTKVAFGAQSCRGLSRSINEDHYVVIQLGRNQETLLTSLPDALIAERFEEYGYAMVVADGVGSGGEAASHLAIATLVFLVQRFGKWNLRIDDVIAQEILARAERFYRDVDSAVVYQRRKRELPTSQTTLTATFGAGRDLFFAHVGHSRAYLCRGGILMQLTRDNTIGQGEPSAAAGRPFVDVNTTARDFKHVLTATIGMAGPIGPPIDFDRLRLEDRDRVLVCTNGLTDMVDDAGIEDILTSDRSPSEQCQALVDRAIASGGDDDATALVAHYRIPH